MRLVGVLLIGYGVFDWSQTWLELGRVSFEGENLILLFGFAFYGWFSGLTASLGLGMTFDSRWLLPLFGRTRK